MMSEMIEIEGIKSLSWYHPNVDRHVAETLLKHNGEDGAYLLRDKTRGTQGEYVLSVRSKDAVNHFELKYNGSQYSFGFGEFSSLDELKEHFEQNPLIAGDNGVLVVLRFPYPCEVEELDLYQKVTIHANIGTLSARQPEAFSVGTKEGYLTKLGGVVKNWKTRWFTLEKYELKYFKTREDKMPIRTIDLRECSDCRQDHEMKVENCIRVVLPWRTFYFSCKSHDEMQEWLTTLRFKLDSLKKHQNQTI